MSDLKFAKPERIWLKTHPELRERWVQERIAEDPAILGLGNLDLKDKERVQPHAGRLDLLLQDRDLTRRFEVEVQLGATDESHIVRTIEYWDIERKRYPQFDHCAVIVAEDITSRYLNVLSLFNGFIPLVALQMAAVKIDNHISLIFTMVMNKMELGPPDDDDESQPANREYWETKRGTKATVAMADETLEMLKSLDPALQLRYNKYYIGLWRDGRPDNFVSFDPRKNTLNVSIRLSQSKEIDEELEKAGLDPMDYDERRGRYRLRLGKSDIKQHSELFAKIFKQSYELNH